MRRRSWLPFIILNVIISAGVALGLFSILRQQAPASQEIITPLIVEIVVTATRDPNATEAVRIITATPLPGTVIAGALPTGLVETPDLTSNPVSTLDAALLEGSTALQGTATALPPGCILHTLQEGEFPSSVAELYGANVFDLMEVNGLDEESATFLQVGEVLIVPLEGCPLTREDIVTPEPTEEEISAESEDDASEEATAEATDEPTVRPTLTLPPTATDAQVTIVEVVSAGDVTAEGVVIRNTGSTVDMTGWTLRDTQGNIFTFPEQLLFSNASVTVFTRVGQNTPVALYWGRSEAIWGEPGDVATLSDADGVAQSVLRLEAPVELR
jgi:LysM repeat protein